MSFLYIARDICQLSKAEMFKLKVYEGWQYVHFRHVLHSACYLSTLSKWFYDEIFGNFLFILFFVSNKILINEFNLVVSV